MGQCNLCGTDATTIPSQHSLNDRVECSSCGTYKAHPLVPFSDDVPRYILSGITRQASDQGTVLTITRENIQQLLDAASIPENPLEAMDRVVMYVVQKSESADHYVSLSAELYPIVFAKNPGEFQYYVSNLVTQGYLERRKGGNVGDRFVSDLPTQDYRLTPDGWIRVEELRRTQRNSSQAFVAMWFDKSLDSVYHDGFKPALEETGYHPIRVDLVEHNEKICDRIMTEIRRSGLIVADTTGNRPAVSFEAGFAMGLSVPIIWTCRKDWVSKLDFDIRQFNHITWDDADDLKEALIYRIANTQPSRIRRAFNLDSMNG